MIFSPCRALLANTVTLAIILLTSHTNILRAQDTPSSDLPNIVVIYTDDQGYGDVSALNPDSKFQTPHIDRLVREGLTFTDGHCSDTVCTPSRYGLLTGRYSWRTRLKNGVMGAEGECLIEPGRMTLASLLGDHGYNTAMVGKWHLGMEFSGKKGKRDWNQPFVDGPFDRGFKYFFGIPASMNYGILTYLENNRVTKPASLWTAKKPGDNKPDSVSYRMMPPYLEAPGPNGQLEVAADFVDKEVLARFLDKATSWIDGVADDAKQGKPFFLYLPLTSPHKPVCPVEQFVGKSNCGTYGDFMVETDYRVGQLLAALDRNELADDTLVIFTSDNGPERTYKQRIDDYQHRSGGRYRGGKRDLYEGGHRVPFIARWPARIEAGRSCNEPVCQTDLLATFADIVGVTLPADAGEDSESLLPAFHSDEFSSPLRGPVIHHSAAGYFAIRDGEWKLNLGRGANGNTKVPKGELPYELYNLETDPSEESNVAADHPEVVDRLKTRITRIVKEGRSTDGPAQSNDVAWWKQLNWIPAP